jgi:ABC-type glycerol-3-phosphate transport system permease component
LRGGGDVARHRAGGRIVVGAGGFAVLVGFIVLAVGPVVWMVYTSFKPESAITESIWSLPTTGTFTFENYRDTLRPGIDAGFGTFYANSLVVTVVSVAATVAAGAGAAYGLARLRLPGGRAVYYAFLVGMMIPVHVTLIPLHQLFGLAGDGLALAGARELYDGRIALVVTYAAFSLPVTVFILYGFFASVPREIEDAARIDGATAWQVFAHIMLPLARPALAVVTIFAFVGIWNEFVFAATLADLPAWMTLPVGLRHLTTSEFGKNTGMMTAGMTLAVAPLVVVFVVFQRHIVRGLTRGALKG